MTNDNTWPNKSNVVTVTVFDNLYEENKYQSSMWRSIILTVLRLSSRLFITFLLRKQRLSPTKTLTHRVLVTKINHHDCQPS